MLSAFEEQKYPAAALHAAVDINPATFRSWNRRGHLAPLEIHATGTRAKYSFLEILLFSIVDVLNKHGFEPQEAIRIAASAAPQVQAMLAARDEWNCWLLLSKSHGSTKPTIWSVSKPDQIADLLRMVSVFATILDVGSLGRETFAKLEKGGW